MNEDVSPMEDKKIYLLAESTVPGFLKEVKAILAEALPPDTPRARLRSLIRDRTRG
jgi:hypothetical protein